MNAQYLVDCGKPTTFIATSARWWQNEA